MREPQLGDTVYYVTASGQCRAATVTSHGHGNAVNLNVHKDGPHDWVGHSGAAGSVVVWVGAVPWAPYESTGDRRLWTTHSWHWPDARDNDE